MTSHSHHATFERQLLYGHTWTPLPGVSPYLLCAMKVRGPAQIRSGRIVHGRWALDYPYSAGLEVRVRAPSARWHSRPAGIAHLYPPGMPYWERRSFRHYPQDHQEVYVMFQDTDRLRCLVDPQAGYARFADPSGALEALLSEAARIGAVFGEKGFWKAQAVLCGILDLLATARRLDKTSWRIAAPDDRDGLTDLARAVETYLREHLGERVTLAEIARHARVSASTLTHRYHAETGLTPMEKLRDLRLTVAKGLLSKGWKLKEIAEQTGFVDAFHFSRTFKSIVGLSPKLFIGTQCNKAH